VYLLGFIKRIIWKSTQKAKFVDIRPVGAELFHADRQTDRQTERWKDTTILILAFRKFMYARKEGKAFRAHAMRVCTEGTVTAPLLLSLCTRWI